MSWLISRALMEDYANSRSSLGLVAEYSAESCSGGEPSAPLNGTPTPAAYYWPDEPGMSWDNYGKRIDQWSIDHSRPISSFPATATLAEINALENLRPMWHRKNCSKKNKWEGQ